MSRLAAWVTCCAATALIYVTLSRLALEWRGDLAPTPLWLATACVTAGALVARPPYIGWLLVGSVLGGVASSVWVYDETARQLVTPVGANVAEILVVSMLVRRWLPPGPSIRRTRDAVRLVVLVAIGVALSASLARRHGVRCDR
jgi:hypothetical protein